MALILIANATELNLKNTGYANSKKDCEKHVGILFEMFFSSAKKHNSKHTDIRELK